VAERHHRVDSRGLRHLAFPSLELPHLAAGLPSGDNRRVAKVREHVLSRGDHVLQLAGYDHSECCIVGQGQPGGVFTAYRA
jgi:hypothetical protein